MQNNKSNSNSNLIEKNWGGEFLRILMAFAVVLVHFWKYDGSILLAPFAVLRTSAVPTFFTMSYFLTAKYFLGGEKEKIYKRFYRLMYPQVMWTVVYFVIYSAFGIARVEWNLTQFGLQMLLGHVFNKSMWFQIDMILVTILFFLISLIQCKNKYKMIIFDVIAIICIWLEYSDINRKLVISITTDPSILYTVGRIVEVLPMAVIGLNVSYFKLFDKIKGKSLFSIACLVAVPILYFAFPKIDGFGNAGLFYVTIGFCFLAFFWLLGNDILHRLYNNFHMIRHIIMEIIGNAKYTMGVYFIHRMIMAFVNVYIFDVDYGSNHGVITCFVVYILCLAILRLLNLCPFRTVKKIIV